MRLLNWPTREEWAKQRRTAYYDLTPDVSEVLADYATTEEIAELQFAMRERWKQLGRKTRSEGSDDDLSWKRRCINRGLKLIRNGELPFCLQDCAGAQDLIAPFKARYEAAKADLYETARLEIERRPIDDAAWEKELKRRAQVEKWLSKPGSRAADLKAPLARASGYAYAPVVAV